MKDKRIFLVANSHIDPVWLWDKFEGIDEVINTFRSACDRLDEYDFLKFSASSTIFYQWVEQYAPEVFERVREHVRSGRWETVGGWIVEADCNLPVAESFLRSAQISRDYLLERFGVSTQVAFCPDAFGHAATMPLVLADSGFKYLIFSRPNATEKPDLPDDLFYWEYAGKRILCYRLKYHYTQGPRWDARAVEQALADEDYVRNGLACYLFGVGDHGGGPSKEEIENWRKIQQEAVNRKIEFSTCAGFFAEAEKLDNIPTYSGDLHFHAVGCYSVNREIKQLIRDAEHGLLYAERLSRMAGLDVRKSLEPLWTRTLFNQFHDIMPGSCSPSAARQVCWELGGVLNSASEKAYEALRRISSRKPAGRPQGVFRVANSLPFPLKGPVEIESFQYYRPGARFLDETGREPSIQHITPSVTCVNQRWVFVDEIPAESVKSYYFDSEETARHETQTTDYFYSAGDCISSPYFWVGADAMIIDPETGSRLIGRPLSFEVVRDNSDTWSHGDKGFSCAESSFVAESSSVSRGPVASCLLVRWRHGDSRLQTLFTLYNELPFVDMAVTVFWAEQRSVLKMGLSPAAGREPVVVKGPGGPIEKHTTGIEEPLHGWLAAGDVAVAQDGAFAFDIESDRVRVTLVRSSLYGYDREWALDPLGPERHTDQGEHFFRFRFFFDGFDPQEMDRRHAGLIEPLLVIRENGSIS